MADVYLASCDGAWVALKTIRPDRTGDSRLRDRLRQEVRALKQVNCPQVARFVEADVDADVPWVAMQYVDGPNLLDEVESSGRLEGDRLVHAARDLALGLAALHSSGLVHRDVKPSNAVVGADGRVVLIDLGIAKGSDWTSLTPTGDAIGSLNWMAPELFDERGETPSTASDMWSWGVTVAYLASGELPYGEGPAGAVLRRILEDPVPRVEGPLASIVESVLAKDPADRPPASSVWVAALTPQLISAGDARFRGRRSGIESSRPSSGERYVSETGGRKRRATGDPEANESPGPPRRKLFVDVTSSAGVPGGRSVSPWPRRSVTVLSIVPSVIAFAVLLSRASIPGSFRSGLGIIAALPLNVFLSMVFVPLLVDDVFLAIDKRSGVQRVRVRWTDGSNTVVKVPTLPGKTPTAESLVGSVIWLVLSSLSFPALLMIFG